MAYAKQGQEGKTKLELLQQTAQDFGHFIYNRDGEDGRVQVMGRDGKSWAKILVFFLIFYGCLAGFFAAMLNIFLTTIPERENGPKMRNLLNGKPGLIAVPFEIKGGDYSSSINDFLKPYKSMDEEKYQNCTSHKREKGSNPCLYDLSTLGECYSNEADFDYGYKEKNPCIFFKMNKVYGFVPKPKDDKDYVELSCKFQDGSSDNLVILPADKPGFLANFYPYLAEKDWLSPIAALKVNTTRTGVVQCEVHAKNIELSETYRLSRGATGKVRIEIEY